MRALLGVITAAVLVLWTTLSFGAVLAAKNSFVISVGQVDAIWLVRADCGEPAPSYSAAIRGLPKTSLGKYLDGGTMNRDSDRCKRAVKVRLILFMGTKAGKQTLTVEGQSVKVEVK